MKIGKLEWSVQLAEKVPLLCKWLVALIMFSSIWYTAWRIYGHIPGSQAGKLHPAWFLWDAAVLISWGIITADEKMLFYVCTFAWILSVYVASQWHRYKYRKRRTQNAQSGKT